VLLSNLTLLIWGVLNIVFATSWGTCDQESYAWLIAAGSVMITFAVMSLVQKILVIKYNQPRAKGACMIFKILMMIFIFAWTIYGLILSSDSTCAFLDLSTNVFFVKYQFDLISKTLIYLSR
jgi:hypothetical protein